MCRFSNAQIGDKVYCRLYGAGIIDSQNHLSIAVQFEKYKTLSFYDFTGKFINMDTAESTLFYRDDTSNYLEQRPTPKLDFSKIPVDTKMLSLSGYKSKSGTTPFILMLLNKQQKILLKVGGGSATYTLLIQIVLLIICIII